MFLLRWRGPETWGITGVLMKLAELIHEASVIPELTATDRNGVLKEMVQVLAENGGIEAKDAETILKAVIARENEGSTGFGRGVAVPHVKHAAVSQMVATIARSGTGVDFAALDRAPVYTILMLLSPADAPDEHLSAMERIFRYLKRDNFRRFLRQADTKEAIMDLIREADEQQDD